MPQSLTRLRAGIIELASLPNDDGAGTDDQNFMNVRAFRHLRSMRLRLQVNILSGKSGHYT